MVYLHRRIRWFVRFLVNCAQKICHTLVNIRTIISLSHSLSAHTTFTVSREFLLNSLYTLETPKWAGASFRHVDLLLGKHYSKELRFQPPHHYLCTRP